VIICEIIVRLLVIVQNNNNNNKSIIIFCPSMYSCLGLIPKQGGGQFEVVSVHVS